MKPTPPNAEANGQAGPAVITGGAGFIGCNLADRLLSTGQRVTVYDNLSRPGSAKNLRWLKERHGERLSVETADVQDAPALRRALQGAASVFHFAAQVAVTSSLAEPRHDFYVNAGGTFNVLEALRVLPEPPPLILTSTNKVYGCLKGLELRALECRYDPVSEAIRANGIGEAQQLDFYSPYGCSKGAADQYALDYARSFGIPAVVFRMSCIYGPHQFGTEDQGWLAHFLLTMLRGGALTIYGDGKQVRDVLFIDDLVTAFLLARENIAALSGHAFNIGGGPENTVSLIELLQLLGELGAPRPEIRRGEWRVGDQRYYVSDCSKFRAATGWCPSIGVRAGVLRLFRWFQETCPPLPHSSP